MLSRKEQRILLPSSSILLSAIKRVKQCVCISIRDRKSICGKDRPRSEWKKLHTKERRHNLNTETATGHVWLKILQEFFQLQGKDFVFPSLVMYNLFQSCFLSVFFKIISLGSFFREHTRDTVCHCGDPANKLRFIPIHTNFKYTFLFIWLLA